MIKHDYEKIHNVKFFIFLHKGSLILEMYKWDSFRLSKLKINLLKQIDYNFFVHFLILLIEICQIDIIFWARLSLITKLTS